MFIGQSMAAGGGGGENDMHLEIHIKAGLESQALLVGGLILLAVYAMIITEVVERTLAAALGGLAAVLALNYYSEEAALSLKAVTTMIDWETIGLLLGMMVMVGILSNTGVFEWFAVEAYKRSGGDVWTLTVILCLVTAVLSAFLDNVTTMLLLTPVTIQLAKGARLETHSAAHCRGALLKHWWSGDHDWRSAQHHDRISAFARCDFEEP